jgi:hypothetical protein
MANVISIDHKIQKEVRALLEELRIKVEFAGSINKAAKKLIEENTEYLKKANESLGKIEDMIDKEIGQRGKEQDEPVPSI